MPAASPVPTLSQIEAWDTSHLNTAATFWTRTATAWEDAFSGVHQQMSRPGGTAWEGVAADAALNRASGDLAKVQGLAEQLRTAAATARSGAGDLYDAQQRAISAVDQAQAAGFDVSEDLSVTSRRTGGDALMQTIRQAHAKMHAVNIRAQAVALSALDQQVATRITTAAPSLGKVVFAEAPIYTRTPKKRNGIQAVDYKQSPIPEPGPPDLPGASEGRTAADLRAATGYLPQGTRPSIKLVRSEEELRRLWNWATENAPERTGSSHPGTQRVLADGTIVSMRQAADSTGKPAIDVRYPDGSTEKYHINQTKGGTPNIPSSAVQPGPRTPAPPQAEPSRPAPATPPGRAPAAPPIMPGAPDIVELPGSGRNGPLPLDSDGIDLPPEATP